MRKPILSTGLRWVWLVLAVILVDFASKQWVMNNMMLHETQPLMPFLNLFYAHNCGAAGNLFDRAYHGFVVDFIDFYIGDWHFATFNIADCGICIGAALVVLEGFLSPAGKQAKQG